MLASIHGRPKTSKMSSRTHSLNPFWTCSQQNNERMQIGATRVDPRPFRKYPNPNYIFLCHDALSNDPLAHTDADKLCVTRQETPCPLPESPCLASMQPALACPKTKILHVEASNKRITKPSSASVDISNPNIVLLADCQCVACFCHHYPVNHLFYTSGAHFIALLELFLPTTCRIQHAIPAAFTDTCSVIFSSTSLRIQACRAFTSRTSKAAAACRSGLHLQMLANVRFVINQQLTPDSLRTRKRSPSHGTRDRPHCRVSDAAETETCFVTNK